MGYYRGPNYYRGDRERERGYGRPRSQRYEEDNGRYRGGRDQEYDDDRGFFDRAGDEVRSWFGDEEAERRRERDAWYDRRYGDPRDQNSRLGFFDPAAVGGYQPYRANHSSGTVPEVRTGSGWREDQVHDPDYHAWRHDRMRELDRDYDEYRMENRDRFNREFEGWRTRRNSQRSSLSQVQEHMDVVGSDGAHVGKVDKVVGDRIILARNDPEAGGEHHWIPSRWIDTVEGETVKLEKTAAQAHDEWRNAERNGLFGSDRDRGGAHYLNRSFAGTYK